MANPQIVGLLGGIGSGKSTAARAFAELGAFVLDADAIAHACLEEAPVKRAIAERFGDRMIRADGAVDRPALAAAAFADERSLADLDAIVHPRVLERLEAELADRAGSDRIVVLDVPLLLETSLRRRCDRLVFVDAPIDARERRVRERRGWAPGELARREAHQAPLREKLLAADDVLVNAGDARDLDRAARDLFRRIHGGATTAPSTSSTRAH